MRFMMQDSIMVADTLCTGGSKMLYNFKPPFSSTVYEKCLNNGMDFIGLIISNEFGIDNLFDEQDIQDSVITALLDDKCDVVLCNDVFGKLRRQAAQARLIYIHPSYGTVSRFGLMPTVSSMDQIGVLCRSLKDGMDAISIISGHDNKDGTSLPNEIYKYNTEFKNNTVIGISKDLFTDTSIFNGEVVDVELKYFDLFAQIFYILSTAEICNNTNRYDGVKYGYRAENIDGINELYTKSRTDTLGFDLQLASIVGCMVLSQEYYEKYYNKAMKIRRLIKDYYDLIFDKVDVIALPVKLDSCTKFEQAALYSLPVLCGYTSISLKSNGYPIQYICKRGNENVMFALVQEEL